ncbi:MAG: hypothetical protein IPL62_04265 [Caulobacteraceae bacterium]|nr:hypothetical protein [Caulobacteraceae bacterium]
MQRRPNIGSAGSDLAFALLALIAGWVGLAPIYAILAFACAVASWAGRGGAVAQMPLKSRLTQGAIAVAMIAVVTGVAYWIGLALGGHT